MLFLKHTVVCKSERVTTSGDTCIHIQGVGNKAFIDGDDDDDEDVCLE